MPFVLGGEVKITFRVVKMMVVQVLVVKRFKGGHVGVNPKIRVFPPKSSILIGCFHYKTSILGYPYFWKHP